MARLLRDVVEVIRDETNRSDLLADAFVVRRTMMAIRFFERNYSLPYMRNYERFEILGGATEPGPYRLPDRYKSMRFMRLLRYDLGGLGESWRLTKVAAEDIEHIPSGAPARYWTDGTSWLWFDAIPNEDVAAEIYFYRYTRDLELDDTHWLFENAEDCIIGKTVEMLLPYLRLSDGVAIYKDMWTQGIRTLILADEEEQRVDTDVWMGMDAEVR